MNTLFGLIGQSLSHSVSPRIHELIFDKLGLSACYHLFEVKEMRLESAIRGLASIGAAGINVTVPYKIRVMRYIDKLSPEAEAIGSVNCIAFDGITTTGYNTDYIGFGMLLEKYSLKLDGKAITVLGSGGASRTVIRYLLDHNVGNVTVVTRSTPGDDILAMYNCHSNVKFVNYEQLSVYSGGELIVNCTPCGMYPNMSETPVGIDVLSSFNTAIDVIYNPLETMFLKQAKSVGLKTANGLYMLVSQAVAAQEIWNGVKFSQSDTDEIYDIISSVMIRNEI